MRGKNTLSLTILLLQWVVWSGVQADDFDWMDHLSIEASADATGFQYRLATRFQVGGTDIDLVIGNVNQPADAYMVFRLGELSHRPTVEVLRIYHRYQSKGWGVIAKQLNIKPGSAAFHALKRGHDLPTAGNAKTVGYPTKMPGKGSSHGHKHKTKHK